MTGINFSITSKVFLKKDAIATIKDPVSRQFVTKSLNFKIPNSLMITSPIMSTKF